MDWKDPKNQKLLFGGLLFAGAMYAYFFTTVLPLTYRSRAEDLKELATEYQSLTSDLNKAKQTVANLPRLEAEFQRLDMKWQAAQELLPNEKEVANLLRRVTLVGQQSSVDFHLFKPLPTVAHGFYVENPVQVMVSGGYHNVGAFLAEVANLPRIVNVSQLKLDSYDKGKPTESVLASFVASAYTLNTAEAGERRSFLEAAADSARVDVKAGLKRALGKGLPEGEEGSDDAH
jgi:type IV pilus assembly protein PilO